MARLTRRGFVKTSGALAAAPALAALAAHAQGPRARHGEPAGREGHRLRQGREHGSHARRLPAAGRRGAEAHGHHSSLRRRLLRRQQERRLHHQRRQGARGQRLHEHLGQLPPPDTGLLAGADSRRQSRDPLDPRERRPPRHRRQQDRRRRVFRRRHAVADGGRHERQEGVRGRRRQRRRQLRRQCLHRRLSAGERADSPRPVPRGPGDAREHCGGVADVRTSAPRSRRRSSFTAPRTARFRCSRAWTSSPSSTASASHPR